MAKDKTVPVTVLKTLGGQAPSFDLPVSIKKLDGTKVELKIKAKALRKTEWAKCRDERQRAVFEGLQAANKTIQAAAEGETPTYLETAIANLETHGAEASVREGIALDAQMVLKFADGWSLDEPLTAEGLELLEDSFGGSLNEIIGSYDRAIYQGRLGN
ncbi:MAG: hypothetical protein EOO31_06800 [Comamonadaceae bacterium]|nr:MAG: hypothetical protein EOO31_06800 [Comamonadaceae bacterium]